MANASTWPTLKQRINQNPEPLVTEEEIKKEADTARVGGYGMVIRDIFTPSDKILKLFFRPSDLDKVIGDSLRIKNNMGPNEGHEMKRFEIPITFDLLNTRYNPIAKKYKELCLNKRVDPSITPYVPLPILVLVDNGIDLYDIDLYETGQRRPSCVYTCPVLPLLQQFLKLLGQTRQLFYKGKIHCDIRDVNVMIDIKRDSLTSPQINIENPRLTIIDFDGLTLKGDYIQKAKTNLQDKRPCDITSFCFYNKPIEGLFLSMIGGNVTLSKNNKHRNMDQVIDEIYSYYLPIFPMIYSDISTTYADFAPTFRAIIQEGINSIKNFDLDTLIDTSDNYGLGFCLLKIIALFYFDKRIKIFKNVNEYENAALENTVELLKKMISFNQDTRILPTDAYNAMDQICNHLIAERIEPLDLFPKPNHTPFRFSENHIRNIQDSNKLYEYLMAVKEQRISKNIQSKYDVYSRQEDTIPVPNGLEDDLLTDIREKATILKKDIKDSKGEDDPDYQKCSDVYRAVFGQPKNSKFVAFFQGRLDNAYEKKPDIKRAILAYEYMRSIAENEQKRAVGALIGGRRKSRKRRQKTRRQKSLKRQRSL